MQVCRCAPVAKTRTCGDLCSGSALDAQHAADVRGLWDIAPVGRSERREPGCCRQPPVPRPLRRLTAGKLHLQGHTKRRCHCWHSACTQALIQDCCHHIAVCRLCWCCVLLRIPVTRHDRQCCNRSITGWLSHRGHCKHRAPDDRLPVHFKLQAWRQEAHTRTLCGAEGSLCNWAGLVYAPASCSAPACEPPRTPSQWWEGCDRRHTTRDQYAAICHAARLHCC
jgi:hypothetical protein